MTVLCNLAGGSLHSLQAWAFTRLIALELGSTDLRWAMILLLCQSLTAIGNVLFETIAGRALQGARFAEAMTAADTMVATGGR
jgi:hypothetical protein